MLKKITGKWFKTLVTRRSFLIRFMRGGLTALLASLFPIFYLKKRKLQSTQNDDYIWQIDPYQCIQCERCVENCVLEFSAVKVVHQYEICGYCKLCFGYFQPGADKLNESAQNQLCPTGAIIRKFVEDPYFEYTIDENKCIGCAKCVTGCGTFGNGSLYLQVRHDRCLNCNSCSIARSCPSGAFRRISRKQINIKKGPDYEIGIS
jgi:Na+-translocating ferredoxin:NAD+ oxidoreductase subunit B